MNSEKISVIMPVLNEANNLRNILSQLKLSVNEELIIVDGGSSDKTMSIASEFTDNVFQTETGRANVMNYGADKAVGEVLLFLHADCVLPANGFDIIRKTLNGNTTSAGAFYLSIDDHRFRFRIIELGANLRSRVTSLLYGDQGIFLKRSIFKKVGGYTDIPLMEDIDISKKLVKVGKLALVNPPIIASSRRWIKEGALYTTLRDWSIAISYTFFNVSPAKLIKHYKDVR